MLALSADDLPIDNPLSEIYIDLVFPMKDRPHRPTSISGLGITSCRRDLAVVSDGTGKVPPVLT